MGDTQESRSVYWWTVGAGIVMLIQGIVIQVYGSFSPVTAAFLVGGFVFVAVLLGMLYRMNPSGQGGGFTKGFLVCSSILEFSGVVLCAIYWLGAL